MGFLKFTKGIFKAAVEVAVTPIDVVKDAATMCGVLTDKDEPYTVKRLKDASNSLDTAIKDLGDES